MRNLIRFARRQGAFSVLLNKLRSRLFDHRGAISKHQNLEWLRQNGIDFAVYAKEKDAPLWKETIAVAKVFKQQVDAKLKNIEVTLGGGGYYEMLYFLTRRLQPEVIVETGVAAGYSSQTFLSAINKNGKGKLYSSDFPYFRLENPEQYIGLLVDEAYKKDWDLLIEGDEINLRNILTQIEKVDLFHYDSDKRYLGRKRAFELLRGKFLTGANIIFDDIQDNPFFHDLLIVESIPDKNWKVLAHNGKFIGWIILP